MARSPARPETSDPATVPQPLGCRPRGPLAAGLAACVAGLATVALPPLAAARVYDAVEVRGERFVPEADIRLACGLEPGIDLTDRDLTYLEDCLMATGVFSAVAIRGEGSTLLVDVTEIPTRPGRIEAGLLYDSEDGPTASLYFERYDLFPGTFGAVTLDFSAEAQSIETSLYQADAFGPDLDVGLDMGLRRSDYDDQGFAQERTLFGPYLAWTPAEALRLEFGLGYRRDRMHGVDDDASLLLQAEEGTVDAPYLRFGLRYGSTPADDAANDPAADRGGFSVSLDQYLWRLGSDNAVAETRLSTDSRVALPGRFDLLLGFDAGIVASTGDEDTRAVDRFYPGGAAFRGFAPRGLGPRDGDDFLGGNRYAVASVEVQRPLGDVFGSPMRAGAFVDVGSAWGLDDDLGGAIDDGQHWRSSVGLTLTFDIGPAPVSLFVAKPVNSERGDKEQNFGLSLTTRF